MSVLDKIKKLRESKPAGGQFTRQRDIFYNFDDGDNIVRLIGEFVRVETHFIAPSAKRKDRGLCIKQAFEGQDGGLPKMINCLDWDTEKEEAKAVKTCPICRLHRIAKKTLKEGGDAIDAEDKKFLTELESASRPNTSLKWNIIDRKDPWITEEKPDGSTVKVKGYKVATIGMEAWKDIEGIFEQLKPTDITDPEEGIDICIKKGYNGVRTCYSANAVMNGKSVKTTPLTEEERAAQIHDLKRIAGRVTERQKIVDALHDDLRQILESEDGAQSTTPSAPASTPAAQAPAAAPAAKPAAAKLPPVAAEEDASLDAPAEEASAEDAGGEDGKQWECFGTVDDPTHPECSKCSSLAPCQEEHERRIKAPAKKSKK